jgi:hypothetical protein
MGGAGDGATREVPTEQSASEHLQKGAYLVGGGEKPVRVQKSKLLSCRSARKRVSIYSDQFAPASDIESNLWSVLEINSNDRLLTNVTIDLALQHPATDSYES